MAIDPKIGIKSLLAAKNFNDQSLSLSGQKGLVMPLTISSEGPNFVEIENAYLSGNFSMIHLESARCDFDGSLITEPYYLMFDDEPGTGRLEVIEDFATDPGDITYTLNASEVGYITEGPIDAFDEFENPSSLKWVFPFSSAQQDGSMIITRSIDISKYSGIYMTFDRKISSPPDSSYIRIYLHDIDGVSRSAFYLTPSDEDFHTYFLDFSNPSWVGETPLHQSLSKIQLSAQVRPYMANVTTFKMSSIKGVLKDINDRASDDHFKIFISSNEDRGIKLATRTGGSWIPEQSVDIPGLSSYINEHTADTTIHIPPSAVSALVAASPSATNPLITQAEASTVGIDATAASRMSILSAMRQSSNHSRGKNSIFNRLALYSETITRGHSKLNTTGSEGYMDPDNSTATPQNGFYAGSITDKTVNTKLILDVPYNIDSILVEADFIRQAPTNDITYNIFLSDNEVLSACELNTEYDLTSFYTHPLDLNETKLRLEFILEGAATTELFHSLSNTPLEGAGNQIALSGSGTSIIAYGDNTLVKPAADNNSWRTSSQPPESITSIHSFLGSTDSGLRLFSANNERGYKYYLNGDSWISSPAQSSSGGRPVSAGADSHHLILSDSMYFIDGATESQKSLNAPFSSWDKGSSGSPFSGSIIATNGLSDPATLESDTMKYSPATDSWSVFGIGDTTPSHSAAFVDSGMNTSNKLGGHNLSSPLDNNRILNGTTGSWVTGLTLPTATSSPFFGRSAKDSTLMYSGDGITLATEYINTHVTRFYGFGLKVAFGTHVFEANHVGFWQDDTFPDFVTCTEAQVEESGFWTDDNGKLLGLDGTFWEYYGKWTDDSAPDYKDATFEERLESGYWTDDSGNVPTYADDEEGPKWDYDDGPL